MTSFRENMRGVVTLTACNLLFLINDTLNKIASADLPLGEIIFVRGLFATALLVPLVRLGGAHRHASLLLNGGIVLRVVAEVFGAFLYLFALFRMPIANTNTIVQIVPLMVTAAGALFFAEAVGWRRWTAIAAGFAGVLIVVRPGLAGFNGFSLFVLAAAFFITLRDVTTRIIPRGLPALLVALVTGVAVGAFGPLFSAIVGETWVMPTARDLALLAAAACFLIGGYLAAVTFMRHGDISVVAPFRYTVIIFAILIGFLVWREVPDWPMLAGTVVIAASGIYTFSRERNLARLAEEAAAGEGL
jgi:drug/metabolite transporter (DMT)-like permease